MSEEIWIGWKAIMGGFGVRDVRTAQRRGKRLKIIKYEGGKPVVIRAEYLKAMLSVR